MSLYLIAVTSMRMSVTAWQAFQRDMLPSLSTYGSIFGEALLTVLGVFCMVLLPFALPSPKHKESRERSGSIASTVTSVSTTSKETSHLPNHGRSITRGSSMAISHQCISCDACGKSNPEMQCNRCQLVYYCSTSCKWKHRVSHKAICNEGKKALEKQNNNHQRQTPEASSDKFAKESRGDSKKDATQNASFECSICLSTDVAYPVILKDCQHQFCYPCIRDWQQNAQAKKKSPKESAASPTCRLCRSSCENVQTMVISNARGLEVQAQKLEGTLLIASAANPSNQENTEDEPTTMQLRQEAIRSLDIVLQGLPETEIPVRALLFKTEILVHMNRMEDALECFDRLLHVSKGVKRDLPKTVGPQLKLLGHKLRANNYIREAQEYQSQEQWSRALPLYQRIVDHLDDTFVTVTPKRRLIAYNGLATCAYHLEIYDLAIKSGKSAIALNRHSPHVHSIVALSYKAQGNMAQAVDVMNQAVLYEAPWDKEHRQRVLEHYEELLSDLQEGESADSYVGAPKLSKR